MARIKRVRIFDMDGVLVSSEARYRTIITEQGERIDLNYWRENEHLAFDVDDILPLVDYYWQCLKDRETYVVIATASVCESSRMRFIKEILGEPDYLISRKPGDEQSGKTLKCNGLAKLFNFHWFKNADIHFYDDNFDYLRAVGERFRIPCTFIPSNQGH